MAKKGFIEINRELCKGCFLCIRACPAGVLQKSETQNSAGSPTASPVHQEKCVACGNCYAVCPDCCIIVFEEAV